MRSRIMLLALACASALSQAESARVIAIDAMVFTPATLEVRQGERVTWKNADPFPHTVASNAPSFRSPEIASGKSWTMVARDKGSFDYICTLHPTMKGRLVVR